MSPSAIDYSLIDIVKSVFRCNNFVHSLITRTVHLFKFLTIKVDLFIFCNNNVTTAVFPETKNPRLPDLHSEEI